jgi:hypothetical protein
METDAPTKTIYKGEMLDVWQDIESVYLRFDSCIVIFPIGCWQKVSSEFRKISNETPIPDEMGTKCGRPF